MTENVQVESGADQSSLSSQPSQQPSAPQAQQPQEKLVPQSHVNRIVQERYQAGIEKGRAEAPSNSGLSEEKVKAMYQEMRAKEDHERAAFAFQQTVENIKNDVLPKLKEAGSKYEDFGKATSVINLENPGLLFALKNVENPADLVYSLSKDLVFEDAVMRKLSSEDQREIQKGYTMLMERAASIKNNESAKAKVVPSPLSTIKPSTTGADNGIQSIADLRRKHLM